MQIHLYDGAGHFWRSDHAVLQCFCKVGKKENMRRKRGRFVSHGAFRTTLVEGTEWRLFDRGGTEWQFLEKEEGWCGDEFASEEIQTAMHAAP